MSNLILLGVILSTAVFVVYAIWTAPPIDPAIKDDFLGETRENGE